MSPKSAIQDALALNARAEGARATMFRLGEVMSISAALKAEYGLTLELGGLQLERVKYVL